MKRYSLHEEDTYRDFGSKIDPTREAPTKVRP